MSFHDLQPGDRIRIENRTPSRFLESRYYAVTVNAIGDGVIRIAGQTDQYSAETGDQLNGHDRIVELIRRAPVLPDEPPTAKKPTQTDKGQSA